MDYAISDWKMDEGWIFNSIMDIEKVSSYLCWLYFFFHYHNENRRGGGVVPNQPINISIKYQKNILFLYSDRKLSVGNPSDGRISLIDPSDGKIKLQFSLRDL